MPLYFVFEVLCLLLACIFSWQKGVRILRTFVPFLGIIVLYEFGTLQGWFTLKGSNLWAVNIITLLEYVFYGSLLYKMLEVKANKRYFAGLFVLVLILCLFNISFVQGFWRLHSYTIVLSSILIIAFICVYFSELLHQVEHIDLLRYPFFWIATGLLFFYLGQFLFFAFFEYMAYKNEYSYMRLFKVISTVSNVILYSCLSIAFLCPPVIKK